jgi:hypothetical protein
MSVAPPASPPQSEPVAKASETAKPRRAPRIYRRIDPQLVHETIVALEARIGHSFPQSGLRKVAQEFVEVSADTAGRIDRIQRRSTIVRIVAWLLSIVIIGILTTLPFTLRTGHVDTLAEAIQVLEAALSASFFIGACILFLLTWQSRMRHQRTMEAIHELRALAHVVDMHQLTKDPPLLLAGQHAPNSASEFYSPADLQRYLDYCAEMLALISKVAVLYVQDSTDPQTIDVIDDIEDLTNGLSRKVWQKIILIQRQSSAVGTPPSLVPAPIPQPEI